MKLSASLLKRKTNFQTPQKKVISFANQDNSFQVREPLSSKVIFSKRSIQGTPSTWYLESNRKQSQIKSIINLLSDSKVSIQQHFQPSNTKICSPVKEETSFHDSIVKNISNFHSKQKISLRKNQKFEDQKVKKRLNFESSQKNQISEISQQKNLPTKKSQNLASRSLSKTKRGISLIKNLSIKENKNNLQPKRLKLDRPNKKSSPKKLDKSIQVSYCKHFFVKIYLQHAKNNEISKYSFSKILLQQNLIEDLVKDRHSVNKIWQQILQLTQNKFIQNLPMKIIFSFLISVLGNSLEQIQIFETQEALMKVNPLFYSQQAMKVFKYFRPRSKQFRLIVLSRPKRSKSLYNQYQ